jgi:hypothetical protein
MPVWQDTPTMSHRDTTDYPDVNELMSSLSSQIFDIAGKEEVVGIYLTGSLATGDFRPGKSDIDFIVVTRGNLPPETIDKLGKMHCRLRERGLPYKLDGDYVPRSAIRRYDPDNSIYPHLGSDGRFAVERHDIDQLIPWAIMRDCGVILYGPPPELLIDEIKSEDILRSNYQTLKYWWKPMLTTDQLEDEEYQAFAILTMCRALYNLEYEEIASKAMAAQRAKSEYPEFSNAIESAECWQQGRPMDFLAEAKKMIRVALKKGNERFG